MISIAKRTLDLAVSASGLVVLAPFLAVLAATIRFTMHEKALFKQERPGYLGRPFTLIKFRTMRTAIDRDGHTLPDQQRLTAVGRFLRSASLDELPELWNVLKGDVSLVGPRPLLPQYLPRYSASQRRRHEVKPGITGWAQVNGRNGLTWEQKFELDVWYVDNQSFRVDLKILWMTLIQVLRRDGISQPGHATMPEFLGTRQSPGAEG